jgi:formylglycine-generating enzyme required for sulfatase activity
VKGAGLKPAPPPNEIEKAMLIAFKLKLALVCAAGLTGPLAVAPLLDGAGAPDAGFPDRPAFVELQPGAVSYRAAGDFTRAGRQAASPLVNVRFETSLAIMRHQTSSADYQRCVEDGACQALDRGVSVAANRPVVQVSWHDANA